MNTDGWDGAASPRSWFLVPSSWFLVGLRADHLLRHVGVGDSMAFGPRGAPSLPVCVPTGFLGDGDFGDDAFDDGVGGDFFGFGFVGEEDAVAQDIESDVFDILRSHKCAAVHEGERAGS